MDDFREWISDNLRYILLGLAIILILVIAIFAVRLISGLADGGSRTKETESETQQTVIVETESETSETLNNDLVQDDPAVLTFVQSFYNARLNKDLETLQQLLETFNEDTQQEIMNPKLDVESYNNISVYTKSGLESGSYVVYVYYDVKVADIETLAPTISRMYLQTNEEGSLYIVDQSKSDSVKDYIKQTNTDSDVQTLIADVERKYAEAEASDPALKDLMDSIGNQEPESVLPDSSDVGVETNKVVTATDVVNVRADSTEDAEVIGMLNAGESVTRVRQLDNGWSEIRYLDGTGYVKSEYLTEDASTVTNDAELEAGE